MAVLKRAEIPRPSWRSEEVFVEAWGGEVVVRPLSLALRLEMGLSAGGSMAESMLKILAATVVDAEGDPVLSEVEWEAFHSEHRQDTDRLLAAALRMSGLVAEDAEKN